MTKWEGGTGRCGVWKGEMGVLRKLVLKKKKEKIYQRPKQHIQMCCLGCWCGRGWCWWGREWRDRQWRQHQLWAPGMWMYDVEGEWHCRQWWVSLLVVSLRWTYQYIKKQQLNLKKKTYHKLKWCIWASIGLLACKYIMWEVGGIVSGGGRRHWWCFWGGSISILRNNNWIFFKKTYWQSEQRI